MAKVRPQVAAKPETKPETKAGTVVNGANAQAAENAQTETAENAQAEKPKTPAKPKKVKFRLDNDPKFTEWPADWNPEKHIALAEADFEKVDILFDWRAKQHEDRAKEYRERAEDFRKTGTTRQKNTSAELRKIATKFEMLKQSLGGKGVDVEAILAEVAAAMTESEAEAETSEATAS